MFLVHPVYFAKITRSWNSFFWQSSSWLTLNPIWEYILPKSNLRPVLGSHRCPLDLQRFQNKLSTAYFLMKNQMNHPVYILDVIKLWSCQSARLITSRWKMHFYSVHCYILENVRACGIVQLLIKKITFLPSPLWPYVDMHNSAFYFLFCFEEKRRMNGMQCLHFGISLFIFIE